MNGVAITTSSEVEKFAHTSSGIRKKLIPGARMVMIVTRKLSAVVIDDAPGELDRDREEQLAQRHRRRQRRVGRPAGGERAARGQEAHSIMTPAIGSIQYESAFRRGNAMSGAPIISGSTKFARPAKTGMTNRKISSDGVDREHAVVLLGGEELHAGLGQLRADQHRQQAADEQEEERGDRVLDPDDLVVGVDAEVVAPACGRRARSGPPGAWGARDPVEPVVGRRGRPGRTAGPRSARRS